MATITRSSEPDHDLTIFTVQGNPSVDSMLAQVTTFYETGPTLLVLWDFTGGSLDLPSAGLRSLLAGIQTHAGRRAGGKTAVAFSADVDYGAGRMLEAFADIAELPFSIRAFREVPEARAWLGVAPGAAEPQ